MPSEKVKSVIEAFKAHFQGASADIPISLRQESPDIMFTALLEDDKKSDARSMSPLYMDPSLVDMSTLGGEDPQETVRSLLAASAPQQPPMPQAMPQPQPGGGAEEEAVPPELGAMFGMM